MKITIPNLRERIETGPLQINDDWPGVFIRGDQALHFAFTLKMILENRKDIKWHPIMEETVLKGLMDTLSSCEVK